MSRKQSNFSITFVLIVILFVLSLLVNCSSKPEIAIIGTWKESNGSGTIEFFKNGSVLLIDGERIVGNFKFIDNDTIEMKLKGLSTIKGKVSISDDELTITMSNGGVPKYKRVK